MRRAAVALAVLVLLGAPASRAEAPAPIDECDWASFRNGSANHGASDCAVIGATNVTTLTPAFLYRTNDSVSSTPAVVDGVLYVGSWDGWFYAFDTGAGVTDVEPLWARRIDDENQVGFGRIVSSPAVVDIGGTRVVLFGGGATLYALDGADGDVLAKTCLDPRAVAERCMGSDSDIEIESSPVAIADAEGADVLVGLDVHNRPGVGRTGIVKLRLSFDADGWALTPVWKFDPEAYRAYRGADLLTAGSGTGGGCGGVWGTAAADPARDVVVFGTASCSSGSDPAFVPAGEKVFGVRYSDGAPLWRYDPPRPLWGPHTDDDFGSAVQLFELGDDLVVGAGSKDGWYYALDALTGAERWKTRMGQSGHLNRDFAIGGVIGSPAVGVAGGGPAIFVTTAISTPIGTPFGDDGADGAGTIDTSLAEDPARMLSLHALDARTGAILWRQPLTRPTYGHPTYSNGIVFVPSTVGLSVQAFQADTGVPLWSTPPLNGAPASGVAVTDGAIFFGVGTRQGGDDDPQRQASGIWGFALSPPE